MNPFVIAIVVALLGLCYSSWAIYGRSNKGDISYFLPLIAAAVVILLLSVGVHFE